MVLSKMVYFENKEVRKHDKGPGLHEKEKGEPK